MSVCSTVGSPKTVVYRTSFLARKMNIRICNGCKTHGVPSTYRLPGHRYFSGILGHQPVRQAVTHVLQTGGPFKVPNVVFSLHTVVMVYFRFLVWVSQKGQSYETVNGVTSPSCFRSRVEMHNAVAAVYNLAFQQATFGISDSPHVANLIHTFVSSHVFPKFGHRKAFQNKSAHSPNSSFARFSSDAPMSFKISLASRM